MAIAPNNRPVEERVDWTDFVYPSPPLGLTERIQKVTGTLFLGASACSGAGTVAVAVALTATPLVVASSFFGLAALSVALAATGIFFLCKPTPENDPELLRKNATSAGQDIETNQLGYEAIQQKYGRLLESQKINVQGLKGMIHRDAQALTFAQFKAKHGARVVFDFVHEDTKAQLKRKYLQYIRDNGAACGGLQRVLSSQEARHLEVGIQDIAPLIVHGEVARSENYPEFLARNGQDILRFITEHHAKERLAQQFLQHAASLPTLGPSKHVQERFRAECTYLQVDEGLIALAYEEEKRHFLNGALDYAKLRERNDFALIQKCDPDFHEALRKSFLTIAYEVAKSDHYKEDRQFLCVDTEELDCLHIDHMNEIAKGMPYLGSDGFKAKFGTELFRKNWIIHENILKFRKELTEYLLKQPLDELPQFVEELRWFDISADDIMLHRFESLGLDEILSKERKIFMDNALRLFSRDELVERFLQHFATVRALLRICPEVFTRRILLAQDALDGKPSISTTLEREIESLQFLEEVEELDTIFQCHLLPQDSPKLKMLILHFIRSHAEAILNGNPGPIWDMLVHRERVPALVDKPLHLGREKVSEEHARHRARLAEINRAYEETLRALPVRKNGEIERLTQESGIVAFKRQENQTSDAYRQAKGIYSKLFSEKQTLERHFTESKEHYEANSRQELQLTAEINKLEAEVTDEHVLQIEFRTAARQLDEVEQKVARERQAKLTQLHARKGELDRQVGQLEERRRKLEKQEATRRRIRLLDEEISKEQERQEKPVTGLWAAVTNMPHYNLTKKQKELTSLKAELVTELPLLEPALLNQLQTDRQSIENQVSRLSQEIERRYNLESARTTHANLQRRMRALEQAKSQLQRSRDSLQSIAGEQVKLNSHLKTLPRAIEKKQNELNLSNSVHQEAQKSYETAKERHNLQRARLADEIEKVNRKFRRQEAEAKSTKEQDLAKEMAHHAEIVQKTIIDFKDAIQN